MTYFLVTVDDRKPYIEPNDLDVAGRVIRRARLLLEACGGMSDPPMASLDRLANLIVAEMSAGETDEEALVKTVVSKYIQRPF